MRWKERQTRVEERVYDAIEELADEFDLVVPFYPEVHYAGSLPCLKDLNLSESCKEEYACISRSCPTLTLGNCVIVFPRGDLNQEFLREEATHFLHLKNSKIVYGRYDDVESDKLLIMREMLGFFGSCVLGRRKNPFRTKPDLYTEYPKALEFTDRLRDQCGFSEGQIHDYWVHKQGYCMSQMLFLEYSAGHISRERVSGLFKENFFQKGKVNRVFREVRSEIGWPIAK